MLEQIRKADEQNIDASRKILDGATDIADVIDNIYEILADVVARSGEQYPISRSLVFAHFIVTCKKLATFAALAVLRGHISESFGHMRMMIESVAFAELMNRRPELTHLWMVASEKDATGKEFRKAFDTRELRKSPLLRVKALMGKQYDMCSKQSHPNLYAFVRALEIGDSDESSFSYTHNFHELSDTEPQRTWLWWMWLNGEIIACFEEMLSADIVAYTPDSYRLFTANLKARYNMYVARWQEMLEADSHSADRI